MALSAPGEGVALHGLPGGLPSLPTPPSSLAAQAPEITVSGPRVWHLLLCQERLEASPLGHLSTLYFPIIPLSHGISVVCCPSLPQAMTDPHHPFGT